MRLNVNKESRNKAKRGTRQRRGVRSHENMMNMSCGSDQLTKYEPVHINNQLNASSISKSLRKQMMLTKLLMFWEH